MKNSVTMLFVCLVMMLGATSVDAVPPVPFEGTLTGLAAIGYCETEGFWVGEDVTIEYKGKNFFDQDGNWVKQIIHWKVEGVVFNASDPDLYLDYKNVVYTEHFDVGDLESRYTGIWALVTVPGAGSIFVDVGLLYYDWTDGSFSYNGGQHQWWDANVDELCQYLTP